MRKLGIVILCAGKGSRIHSQTPKVLLEVGGIPLISHVVATAKKADPAKIIAVTSPELSDTIQKLHPEITVCEQPSPQGTAQALACAMPELEEIDDVMTLLGDVPLVNESMISSLSQALETDLALLTFTTATPQGYGRIVRNNGRITAIREEKDASADERKISECFSGILIAKLSFLQTSLPRISNNNAQQEFYLTSLVDMTTTPIQSCLGDYSRLQGINTLTDKALVERSYQYQRALAFMSQGVDIMDPSRVDFRGQCDIAPLTQLDINVIIENSSIGTGCRIGANAVITNSTIAENTTILPGSIITGSNLGSNVQIGPYTHLRDDVHVENDVHLGNFVEAKSSYIRQGTRAKHLSYIGNANIGQKVNIGAGTITCNYDGKHKHTTVIGSHSFIGSNCALIAPINLGKNVLVAAGSTVTDDVGNDQTVFARARQVTKAPAGEV